MAEDAQEEKATPHGVKKNSRRMSIKDRVTARVGSFLRNKKVNVPKPKLGRPESGGRVVYLLEPSPIQAIEFKRQKDVEEIGKLFIRAYIVVGEPVIIRREYTKEGYILDEREVKKLVPQSAKDRK